MAGIIYQKIPLGTKVRSLVTGKAGTVVNFGFDFNIIPHCWVMFDENENSVPVPIKELEILNESTSPYPDVRDFGGTDFGNSS